jgi:hypothetical protein
MLLGLLLSYCTITAHEPPELVEGEIALTDSPFCDFFVVHTERGFSLLDWRGGLFLFAEGDLVKGPLHAKGLSLLEVRNPLGRFEMRVMIEEHEVDLASARSAFYGRCHPDEKPAF